MRFDGVVVRTVGDELVVDDPAITATDVLDSVGAAVAAAALGSPRELAPLPSSTDRLV